MNENAIEVLMLTISRIGGLMVSLLEIWSETATFSILLLLVLISLVPKIIRRMIYPVK